MIVVILIVFVILTASRCPVLDRSRRRPGLGRPRCREQLPHVFLRLLLVFFREAGIHRRPLSPASSRPIPIFPGRRQAVFVCLLDRHNNSN